ncbi:helix-turn-helix transcriptional regulator [Thermithiobacillus plumbiphilus]|uniref:Helix-turn-helix transcriptional regulator n=1 Tax=Thermithiobacillus plumbiphilus TaxID=1729899 RepID=A0ABU9DDB5_9PROT
MNHPTATGIRQLREQAGLDPTSIARRLDLSLQDYLAIEAGQQPIPQRTWCQMQSLRYEFKSLFGETPRSAA